MPKYKPLGLLTRIASAAIVADVVLSVLWWLAPLLLGLRQGNERSIVVGSILLLYCFGNLCAGSGFAVWIYTAARNVRALGRTDLVDSPAWCVAWFFVPIANLYRPYRAVDGVWKASDPDSGPDDWDRGSSASSLKLWWVTFLAGSTLTDMAMRLEGPPRAAVGLFASFMLVVAAATAIELMQGIDKRQQALAERIQAG
jgi:hypothetical protein